MTIFNKTKITDAYGFVAECTPTDQIRTAQVYKLIGGIASDAALDTNFWNATLANGGTITETGGNVILKTNTTPSGSAIISSVRNARYVAGVANYCRAILRMDTGVSGNVRRWGAFTTSTGAFFELNGTTLRIVTRNASNDTIISSGSFNGQYGTTYTNPTVSTNYEIYYTTEKVHFVINSKLLHTVQSLNSPWTSNIHLPLRLENINTSINNDISVYIRGAAISRLGPSETDGIYKYITTATTTICKYSPGKLHRILCNDGSTGSSITIYDNITNSGTIIATINTAKVASPTSIELGVPFFTGLTIVSTGTTGNFTVIYE